MDNQFVLRRADMIDANALSGLCQTTFNETYVEDFFIPYPQNDLDYYYRSSASSESFAKKLADPRCSLWVIEDKTNDELIAYAVVGPCDVDDIPHPNVQANQDALLNRLYVQRDRRNHGFGQQLMHAILTWLEEHYSGRSIWLAVLLKKLQSTKVLCTLRFQQSWRIRLACRKLERT